jgi:hypothetical protein
LLVTSSIDLGDVDLTIQSQSLTFESGVSVIAHRFSAFASKSIHLQPSSALHAVDVVSLEAHSQLLLSHSAIFVPAGKIELAAGAIQVLSSHLDVSLNQSFEDHQEDELLSAGSICVGVCPFSSLHTASIFLDRFSSATASASALHHGHGGSINFFSSKRTHFAGKATVLAGSVSGNGGSIEVSSAQQLSFTGNVDLGSPSGLSSSLFPFFLVSLCSAFSLGVRGELFLDPVHVIIGEDTANDTALPILDSQSGLSEFPDVWYISSVALSNALASGDVRIAASESITIMTNITVVDGSYNLTLIAGTSLSINNTISIPGRLHCEAGTDIQILAKVEAGFVNITADTDYDCNGALVVAAPTGELSITGSGTVPLSANNFIIEGPVHCDRCNPWFRSTLRKIPHLSWICVHTFNLASSSSSSLLSPSSALDLTLSELRLVSTNFTLILGDESIERFVLGVPAFELTTIGDLQLLSQSLDPISILRSPSTTNQVAVFNATSPRSVVQSHSQPDHQSLSFSYDLTLDASLLPSTTYSVVLSAETGSLSVTLSDASQALSIFNTAKSQHVLALSALSKADLQSVAHSIAYNRSTFFDGSLVFSWFRCNFFF